MAMKHVALASLVFAGARGARVQVEVEGRANPIRKVVNMLQGMQKKVQAEGERDEALFDKFMCYCALATIFLMRNTGTSSYIQ